MGSMQDCASGRISDCACNEIKLALSAEMFLLSCDVIFLGYVTALYGHSVDT